MELLKYEKEYTVHVYETGPDGRLNLYSFFDYLQDVASDHAVKLGFGREDLLKHNNLWVLSRIYAEISCWPQWGERITIKTWPRGTDKLFALRDFEARKPGGELIALATSSWLIVDRDTKRIQRPDDTLTMYNSLLRQEKAISRNSAKLEPTSPDNPKKPGFNVRISDLDINMHVNNTRYLKWVVDSYDLDFILNHAPISAELNYLAESHINDNISVLISEDKVINNSFNHSVIRTSDNTELCRLRINWKNNHS